jgi:hypothetical protein
MRIFTIVLTLLVVTFMSCAKSTPPPASGNVVKPDPDPMQELEKPDDTKYPLVGDYNWRVVEHKMIRGNLTTLNNWDLSIRFSPDKASFIYNGGDISHYPTIYSGDTVKITFKADSAVVFWKSMHFVEGKYEWHLEGANCHCENASENFDVYELRR